MLVAGYEKAASLPRKRLSKVEVRSRIELLYKVLQTFA